MYSVASHDIFGSKIKITPSFCNRLKKTANEITYIQPRLEWDAHELLSSNVPEEVIWAIFCGGLTKDRLVKVIFERINTLKLTKKAQNEYFRTIELMTNNTSLQKPVANYMKIYGIEIDITKDRYYKAGKVEGIDEGIMAERIKLVNGMRQKGMSNEEIKVFLADVMQLSVSEIQALVSSTSNGEKKT